MFFARINKLRHTLAFRLTLWYALVFVISASIVFVTFYVLITRMMQQRIDDDLLAQSKEFAAVYALQGAMMLQRTAALQSQAAGEKKMFYRLFYPSGIVFSSSNMSYWKAVGIDRQAVNTVLGNRNHVFASHVLKGQRSPARVIYYRLGTAIILQMGYAMEAEGRLLQVFKQIFTLTMSVLLVLAVGVGWFMARRALSGVGMVTRTAQQISEEDLQTRVPVRHRHNEIDLLAHTFNQMLDRIQTLVSGTRQMNDNIAHDLRSPITRIRGLAEVTLTHTPTMVDFQQMAASTIEECDRLLDMINTMLTISRTEAGAWPKERRRVDLAALVAEACELFQPLAEDKQVQLTHQIDGDGIIQGDPPMLQRLVANLIDNAIKYTNGDGHVTVTLGPAQQADRVTLSVADNGAGIGPEEQSRLFDRFFRGDQSRAQGGAGLGLSLARAIAHAHGGEIQVQSAPGRGATFTVDLPVGEGI
jgi:heavy metal sensor kinase